MEHREVPRGPGEGGAEGKAGEKHTDSEAIAKVNVYPLRSFLQDGVLNLGYLILQFQS